MNYNLKSASKIENNAKHLYVQQIERFLSIQLFHHLV